MRPTTTVETTSNSTNSSDSSSSYEKVLQEKLSAIPQVEFVEDLDAFMALPENAENAQATLQRIEELYHRLKALESNNVTTKGKLKAQSEELSKTLEMLDELKRRKANSEVFSNHFRLADHVFVQAKVKPVEKVGLWLGANVMLEFELDEAGELLNEKKQKADESLKMTKALIDSVREQITTIEVNMARIYNWDVKRRQVEKQKAGITSS